jgi:glucose/arabinose dehydrogenase
VTAPRLPRPARLGVTALATALLVAACADGDDSTPVTTRPSADVATTSGESAVPPSAPTSSSPSSDDDDPATSGPAATTGATTPTPTSAPADDASADPLVEPAVELLEVATFDQPVQVVARPDDERWYVVEQPGRVVLASDEGSDVALDVTDLTDADGERGLLGLAFHPSEPLAYLNFTDNGGDTVVAEVALDPATGLLQRDSLREVMTVAQPYGNHNGGQLAFGPDGHLYIGLGDGGSRDDPERNALDLSTPLGKILRIDPLPTADGQPYGVPADNPFVDQEGADPTVWSYGLRNPWRFSFDPETGDLWIADVGQGEYEEINHAPASADTGRGANFGWSAFEGLERFNDDQPADGAVPPVHVYDHSDGRCSVSGGVVVRGSSVPDLDGWYVFGDYCSGEIWALDPAATPDAPRVVDLGTLPGLAAINVGPGGDVYAVSNAGPLARLVGA